MPPSNHDVQQYERMRDVLDAFQLRNVEMGKMIADLETLLRSLTNADQSWKEAFYREWALLDDIYAVAVDRGYSRIPAEQQKLVDKAVQKLIILVNNGNAEA